MVPLTFAVVRLLIPGLFAAQAPAVPDEIAIPPVIWEMVSFSEPDRAPVTIPDPWRYTVQFLPEGRLLTRLDCNQGSGGYTAAAGVLALTPLAVTTAMCPPDSVDTTFQRLLARATSYRFDPEVGALLLRGEDGVVQLQPVLPGVVWQWQGNVSSTGEVTTRPDDPSQYTVEFLPDGTLAIQADCNHATGNVILTGSQLDLQIGGVTKMACPPGSLMTPFLADLDQVVSYTIQQTLTLALAGGNGVMQFAPVVAEAATATPGTG
jgi:heat shock protein HslJ